MREWLDHWTTRYGIIVFAAIAGYLGYTAIAWCKLSASDWAAWVQAIGSIGAIIGAIYIANRGTRDAAQARQAEILQAQLGFATVAWRLALQATDALETTVHTFRSSITEKKYLQIGTERIEDLQASLQNFTSKDIPAAVYVEIMRVQTQVAYTLSDIRASNRSNSVSNGTTNNCIVRIESITDCVRNLDKKIQWAEKEVAKLVH